MCSCPFPLCHVRPHVITVISTHWVCMCSCSPVCVCVLLQYLPPCPTLHALPPHCSASPPARAESAAGARRKSSSLRYVAGESKQEAHKRRKCCFPHAGSSWVSYTLLVHNISFSHRVPFAVTHNTSAPCSCSV